MKLYKYLILTTLLNSINVLAQQCPVPRTAIDFKIDANVQFDKNHQDFIYTYKVSNGLKAKTNVIRFKLESQFNIYSTQNPSKWNTRYKESEGDKPSYLNFTSFVATSLKPGSSPIEFKFKSKQAPGMTVYYAEGSSSGQLRAITVNGDNEVAPVCPGFFIDEKSILKQMVSGITIGPVPANQVDAKIKMKVVKANPQKNEDDEAEEPEVSPADEGVIELILYNAKDVDLSTVNLSSIMFGPYGTAPVSSELIQTDGKIKHWRHKPNEKKLILMKFKLSEVKIRCDLDKALILKADAGEKKLVGAVKIKPKICDKNLMEVHSKRLKMDPKNHRQFEGEH